MIFDDVILRNSDVSESPSSPSTPSELNSENLEKINFTAEVSDLRALVRERSILSEFIPLGMEDTQEGLLYYRVSTAYSILYTVYLMMYRCHAQWELTVLYCLNLEMYPVPFRSISSDFILLYYVRGNLQFHQSYSRLYSVSFVVFIC